MDPNPIEHRVVYFPGKSPKIGLQLQAKARGVSWFDKHDEEGVTRRADFLGVHERTERLPDKRMMSLDKADRVAVAQILLQLCGTYHVGEDHGEQTGAVLSLKFPNLGTALECW